MSNTSDIDSSSTSDTASSSDIDSSSAAGTVSPDVDSLSDNGDGPALKWEPLFENAPVCEEESLLLVSLFATRHGLSDVAVQDLLQLLALHCPQPNRCITSLYRYKRLNAKLHGVHGATDRKQICGNCHQESCEDFWTTNLGLRESCCQE